MGKILTGVALCAAMALSGSATGAISAVGQAIQKLRLTPQQLLSLRDVLGGVDRGAQVEASGEGLFILRDPGSMAYVGEFSVTVAADGIMTVDRVTGPATLDGGQRVLLPARLNPKSRAQILAALAGSQILATDPANPQAAVTVLPEASVAALKFADAKITGPILQARAIFFRDGSGVVRTVRVARAAAPGTSAAPTRISERYFSAVKSDGTHAWRDNVLELDNDLPLSLSELEAHPCPGTGPCSARRPAVASIAVHFIRWQHQLVAAVPPSLLAQLAAAPAPEMGVPAGTELPAQTPAILQGTLPPGSPTPAGPDNNPSENSGGR